MPAPSATPAQPTAQRAGIILASPQDKIGDCLDRMVAGGVGSILVTEDDRPVGILTERDVLRLWRRLAAPGAADLPVADVCTRPVFTLRLDGLGQAAAEMVRRRIRHVPLVDDGGKVIGIVSMRDILAAQLKAGTLPALRPVAKPLTPAQPPHAEAPASGTLHLLTPTAQLSQICLHYLPDGWRCRLWSSLAGLEQALDSGLGAPPAEPLAFMLDLDGLEHGEDWRPLVKRFIKQLTSREQPELFLVSTPVRYPAVDVASLRAVAAKAHWRIYQRPLPVTALGDDLSRLGGHATAESRT